MDNTIQTNHPFELGIVTSANIAQSSVADKVADECADCDECDDDDCECSDCIGCIG